MKYAKVVEQTIISDLENPSDELVKYFLTRPEIKPNSRITSHTIEKYREITAKTIRKMMGVTINSASSKNEHTKVEKEQDIVATETIITETPIPQTSVQVETSITIDNAQPKELTSIEDIKETIKDYRYQEEDNPNFTRIHIYADNNQKLGIIKILKPDMKIQVKLVGNPTFYDISTADQIKEYFQ